jgi:histidinol-phosphate aminotransferase
VDIERIVTSEEAQNSMIVVDEAYVDFSTKGSGLSFISKYPNVLVLQTLSKAFGMAAVRCGFCYGPPDAIQLMNNVKAPYNVNSLTSNLALNAMENTEKVEMKIRSILEQREIVESALNKLDFVVKVYPSDANFLLFRLAGTTAKEIYKKMADDGVVTRFRGTELHCEQCIRVTVGTPEENEAFLSSLVRTYKLFE